MKHSPLKHHTAHSIGGRRNDSHAQARWQARNDAFFVDRQAMHVKDETQEEDAL